VTVSPAVLAVVAQACRDGDRLEFGYLAADGTPTERRVEPYRLVSLGRRWYLVAYDLGRHEWRTFRLDRLTLYSIHAEIAAPAESVRARIGRWAEVNPLSDSECAVQIRADSMDWAVLALGMTDADFRVTGPPEFTTYLTDLAGRLSRAVPR
jgi:predicted DNA-binding transcriptional regulator YafY